MLSECKENFEDADISLKMDELLQAAGLPVDIDVIPYSTGDSKAPPTPHPLHFTYENVDFTTIIGNVSIIT
jgi:hypothetical protein